jgi:hypothetical protein
MAGTLANSSFRLSANEKPMDHRDLHPFFSSLPGFAIWGFDSSYKKMLDKNES